MQTPLRTQLYTARARKARVRRSTGQKLQNPWRRRRLLHVVLFYEHLTETLGGIRWPLAVMTVQSWKRGGYEKEQSFAQGASRWARRASCLSPGAVRGRVRSVNSASLPLHARTHMSHAHISHARRQTHHARTHTGLNIRDVSSAGGGCESFTVGANELTKRPLPSKQGASKVSLQVPPMCSVQLYGLGCRIKRILHSLRDMACSTQTLNSVKGLWVRD
jgi:hypothetical protein